MIDDPSIDTTSRTGKLILGILALIAELENDIRRERQQGGINKAKAEGVRFGPKPLLTEQVVEKIKQLRAEDSRCPRSCAARSSPRHPSTGLSHNRTEVQINRPLSGPFLLGDLRNGQDMDRYTRRGK